MDFGHLARGAASAERTRRLMALRGYTPNGHPLWNEFETVTLSSLYPDYRMAVALIRRRTFPAAYGKAGRRNNSPQAAFSRLSSPKRRTPLWSPP